MRNQDQTNPNQTPAVLCQKGANLNAQSTLAHILLSGCFLLLCASPAIPCSSFLMKQGNTQWMGKSYDWHDGNGLLIVNKRHVKKVAFLPSRLLKPARWTSRFGSVTFTQYGREHPLGGINEKGLAIEILWLNKTRHGTPSRTRPSVNELQWIQYHLDTSATVPQMIAQARKLQIVRMYAQVHYFACDPQGRCATFEILNGTLTIHHSSTLPVPAITNNTYKQSLRDFKRVGGMTKQPRVPLHNGSLARFSRIGVALRTSPPKNAGPKPVFQLLQKVYIRGYSQWQIAYNMTQPALYFRASAKAKSWRAITLSKLRFSCRTPMRAIDLRGTIGKRPALKWQPYTIQLNNQLVRRSLGRLHRHRGMPFPPMFVKTFLAYPSTTICQPPHKKPTK